MLTGLALAIWMAVGGAPIERARNSENDCCCDQSAMIVLSGPSAPRIRITSALEQPPSMSSERRRVIELAAMGGAGPTGSLLADLIDGQDARGDAQKAAEPSPLKLSSASAGMRDVAIGDPPADRGARDARQGVRASLDDTPESGMLLLLGTGLAALARISRRRRAPGP
jgi:hypothetical protein